MYAGRGYSRQYDRLSQQYLGFLFKSWQVSRLVADDGRAEFDTSIVASMEVNGIVYQGVLFAQPPNVVSARIWQHVVEHRVWCQPAA